MVLRRFLGSKERKPYVEKTSGLLAILLCARLSMTFYQRLTRCEGVMKFLTGFFYTKFSSERQFREDR